MRFTLATPLVFIGLLAFVSASPIAVRSTSVASTKAQTASLLDSYAAKFRAQDAKLKQLDVSSVTASDMKPITQSVVELVNELGQQLNTALLQLKQAGGNQKRQALLQPAVFQLVNDLNTVLVDVEPLLRHLTTNLELGTVQDLVDGLTPALATLIIGVEALLNTLAPGLATIVDPLLRTVYGLTNALGLPLNLPSIQ